MIDPLKCVEPVEWEAILKEIRKQVSKPSFQTWFKYTSVAYEDETYIIFSPNEFSAQWLHSRYSSLILKVMEDLAGHALFKLEFRSLNRTIHKFDKISDRVNLNLGSSEG